MESTLCSYLRSPPILATSNDNRTNEQKSFSTTHFQINAFSTFLGYKILFSGYYYFANPTPYSDETHALDHWAFMWGLSPVPFLEPAVTHPAPAPPAGIPNSEIMIDYCFGVYSGRVLTTAAPHREECTPQSWTYPHYWPSGLPKAPNIPFYLTFLHSHNAKTNAFKGNSRKLW